MMPKRKNRWIEDINMMWFRMGAPMLMMIVTLYFVTSPSKQLRLILAAQAGNLGIVEKLLVRGTSPNVTTGTKTPLIAAIKNRHLAVVELLLARGADPNYDGGSGVSPLTWAVRAHDIEMMRLVLKFHADPHWRNRDGTTPVDQAQGSSNILNEMGR
jgi:ankyrin repeat protein